MLNDFEKKSNEIITSALNGHKNIGDWIDDSNDVEEAFKKLKISATTMNTQLVVLSYLGCPSPCASGRILL